MALSPKSPGDELPAVDWNIVIALAVAALRPTNNLADVTDASTARANLSAASQAAVDAATAGAAASLKIASNLGDLASAAAARTNLGLGTSATRNVGTGSGMVAAGDDPRFAGLEPVSGTATITSGSANNMTLGLGTAAAAAVTTLTATGTATLASASAAYAVVTGGATQTNGGAVSVSTAGTDTNTHLLLTTKNANSVVQSNRPVVQSLSSSLNTLVGARNQYTAFLLNNNFTYAGALAARFASNGSIGGTPTGSSFAINEFTLSADDADATTMGGLAYLYVSGSAGGTNFKGNRTGITGKVILNTSSPNQTDFRFLTGGSFGASASAKQGGFGNGYAEMSGYVFGALLQAQTTAIGTFTRQIVGLEINPEIADEALDQHGLQVVVENGYPGYGIRSSVAYGLANQTSATHPGWDFGFSFLLNNGKHALNPTRGTVLGANDNQYSTSPAAAFGVDLVSIALSQAAFRGPAGTSIIDGSGNIGGQIVAGTRLQTRSEVRAETAVVNTITVVDGSLILAKPTLTVAAPPDSGTQATAAVNTMGAALLKSIAGTPAGYVVGEDVTLVGGTYTTAAVFTVEAVSGGVPTRLSLKTVGSYTVLPNGTPTSPVSTLASAGGTGLALVVWWTILTVTVSGAGSNYPLYPPPVVTAAKTTSGSDISPLRRPIFQVAMTATRATLQLNAGKFNVAGIPTSASGLSTGDVWNDSGTLKVA